MELNDNRVYTLKEAAEVLQISDSTIRRWIREKKIITSKMGRLHRITGVDIKKALDDAKR